MRYTSHAADGYLKKEAIASGRQPGSLATGSSVPNFLLESSLGGVICGVDEAGRGPLAGPVFAAAAILDPARIPHGIDDSKRLDPARRVALCEALCMVATVAVGEASVAEIDRDNILWATMTAMRRAVAGLARRPDHALVDGNRAPSLPCAAHTIVGGDRRSLSIAAASIVAKVHRDRRMAAPRPGLAPIRLGAQRRLPDPRASRGARAARPEPASPPQFRPRPRRRSPVTLPCRDRRAADVPIRDECVIVYMDAFDKELYTILAIAQELHHPKAHRLDLEQLFDEVLAVVVAIRLTLPDNGVVVGLQ